MKIGILGSAPCDPAARQYMSSYLINEGMAIDAGCENPAQFAIEAPAVYAGALNTRS